jgi:hypothetical protein
MRDPREGPRLSGKLVVHAFSMAAEQALLCAQLGEPGDLNGHCCIEVSAVVGIVDVDRRLPTLHLQPSVQLHIFTQPLQHLNSVLVL